MIRVAMAGEFLRIILTEGFVIQRTKIIRGIPKEAFLVDIEIEHDGEGQSILYLTFDCRDGNPKVENISLIWDQLDTPMVEFSKIKKRNFGTKGKFKIIGKNHHKNIENQ